MLEENRNENALPTGSKRTLRLVAAALVLVGLLFVVTTKHRSSVSGKNLVIEGKSATNGDTKMCVDRLESVMDEVAFDTPTASLWNVIPIASDAVLGYANEAMEGIADVGKLTEETAKSVPAVNQFDWTSHHKAVQSNDDHVMVFPDNTVVVIDTKKCEISSLWLPSREGDLHPRLGSNLASRVAVAEDKGNKGPDCSRAFAELGEFADGLKSDVELVADGKAEEGNEWEGDIVISKRDLRRFYGRKVRTSGLGLELAADGLTNDNNKLWPGGVMYYKWGSTITKASKSDLEWAMNHIRSRVPGVRFVQRTNQANYVEFIDADRCSSAIGKSGGRQTIKLKCTCGRGSAAHEILHAFGFWHEQSRPDRNSYVDVHLQNVKDGKEHNFQRRVGYIDSRGSPYDYGSIMHYGSKYFSKNGRATITAKNGASIGQRNGLSGQDIWQMQTAYPIFVPRRRCSSYYGGSGGGYFSVNHFGKRVTRVCGRSGRLLDQIRVQYNDGSWSRSYGGSGGGSWCTNFPSNDNCIREVFIRSGRLVDRVQFRTSKGRLSSKYGGGGGSLVVIRASSGCLTGFRGRSGRLVDRLAACFN